MGAGNPYHSFFFPIHRDENHGYVDAEHTYYIDSPNNTYRNWLRVNEKIKKVGLGSDIFLEESTESDSRHENASIILKSDWLKVLVGEDQVNRVVLGLLPAMDYEEYLDYKQGFATEYDVANLPTDYVAYLATYCEHATKFIQGLYKALSKTQELRVRSGSYTSSLVPPYTKETGMQYSELHFNSFRLNLLPTSALI